MDDQDLIPVMNVTNGDPVFTVERDCHVYFFTQPWSYSLLVRSLIRFLRLENSANLQRWILLVEYQQENNKDLSVPGEVFQFEAEPRDGRIHVTSSRFSTQDSLVPFKGSLFKIGTTKVSPLRLIELAQQNSYNGTQAPFLAVGAKCHSCIHELAQEIVPNCYLSSS